MKCTVSDLMTCVKDDTVTPKPNAAAAAASAERIKEDTMKKINEIAGKRTKRRTARIVAAVVAVAAVLTGSVLAATHYLSVRTVAPDETVRYVNNDGQTLDYPNAGAILNAGTDDGTGYDVCFQTGYLPVGADAVTHSAYTDLLYAYAEALDTTVDELLPQTGLTAEEAEAWDTSLWYDGEDGFFRIDAYNSAQVDGTDFVLNAETTTVQEGELNGIQATWVVADYSTTMPERVYSTMRHIFLYSESMHCLIDVYGSLEFDELEQIAEGLTLRQTDMEPVSAVWQNGFNVVDGGVG